MRASFFSVFIVIALLFGLNAGASPFNKVMIVVLENTNADVAIQQPFLSSLAKRGALLENFHGVAHPSQPNYIGLVAGRTWGYWLDTPVDIPFTNIVDLLEEHGKTWKVYAESYPGHCFVGDVYGTYYRKHNPLISFVDIHNVPARCAHIVNAGELKQDWNRGNLPDYSFYVPDINDDGHNTTPQYSDAWLQKTFAPLLAEKQSTKGLLLAITFDESETYLNNHIVTVLDGSGVKTGAVSDVRYDHYNLLRTIEDGLRLGTLGREDAEALPITGVWN